MTARPHEVLTETGRFGRVDAILNRLPAGVVCGAEIGVFRGAMSAQLLAARPDLLLVMVDSWAPEQEQPARPVSTAGTWSATSIRPGS